MARTISPQEAARLRDQDEAVFIDVREPEEFGEARIAGARLAPLSVLEYLPPDEERNRTAVFFCRSGRRTADAAARLEGRGYAETLILDGGLNGWRQAGLPVEENKASLPLMRQVHIAAGALVLVFLLLGQIAPAFRILAALVGCGLLLSGLTGFCGMALLLTRMPWNTKK